MPHRNGIIALTAMLIGCCAAATIVYSQPPDEEPIPSLLHRRLSRGNIRLPVPPRPKQDGYRGTIVRSSVQVEKKLAADIATELANKQPSVELVTHFGPMLSDPTIRLAGWTADIEQLKTDKEKSVMVVRFTPIIERRNGSSVTAIGCVDVNYEFSNGKLTYLKQDRVGDPGAGRFFQD